MYQCKNENVKILSDLPIWESGRYKGKVNSEAMEGMSFDVEYWGKIYEGIKILEHIKGRDPKFKVKYKEKESEIVCGSFLKGNLGRVLSVITKDFKVKIGQSFKDEKRDLVIIGREHIKVNKENNWVLNEKWYNYKCNKCNYKGWVLEGSLLGQKSGCACCASNILVPGINDIYTTDKWMCDLGVSDEDAKTHTRSSNKKISVICPYCKKEKSMVVGSIYREKSIRCSCGDGTSYPEKVMSSVLNQLDVDYIKEYVPEWCNDNKRYDFYIKDNNTIIETHGVQHYEESPRGRTLKEEQENDRFKRESALTNGIEHYIVLDCRESDLEYIKNSVLESKLNNLFNLSQIDWLKCEEFALKNIVKEICEYWNSKEDWETTTDLGLKFKVNRNAITRYLKKGAKLGWCGYDAKEENKKAVSKNGKLNGKRVEIFKDGVSLGIFESCAELERQSEELFGVRLLNSTISRVCNGKYPHYKGYTFKYIG